MAETAADYEASKQVRTRSWYKLPRPNSWGGTLSARLHISHTLCHELENNCSKHELMENILERNPNSECIAVIRFLIFNFFTDPRLIICT